VLGEEVRVRVPRLRRLRTKTRAQRHSSAEPLQYLPPISLGSLESSRPEGLVSYFFQTRGRSEVFFLLYCLQMLSKLERYLGTSPVMTYTLDVSSHMAISRNLVDRFFFNMVNACHPRF
jgi:hypothetical protein